MSILIVPNVFLINLNHFILENLILYNLFHLDVHESLFRYFSDFFDVDWFLDDFFIRNFNYFFNRDFHNFLNRFLHQDFSDNISLNYFLNRSLHNDIIRNLDFSNNRNRVLDDNLNWLLDNSLLNNCLFFSDVDIFIVSVGVVNGGSNFSLL